MQIFKLYSKRDIINEILRQERIADCLIKFPVQNLVNTPVRSYVDISSQLKIFSGVEDNNPTEQVARANKALLRKKVIDTVKEMVFQQNLPYVHLSYYPHSYRTICAFRIDCDVCDRLSFFNLLKHADKHALPMTWFIDVGTQKGYLNECASIRKTGHDVQLHCYHHDTFNNYRDNEINIRKGKSLLEAAGVSVSGFAAPYGQWNPWLNQVLEDLNFSYSSEFAIGYDDIPFYPFIGKRFSRVLQIPIHPICLGSLAKVGCSPIDMKTYFERIIKLKYQRRDPILLYGHPQNEMDKFPEVVDFIFSKLKELQDIWITTFGEYANWWQRRLMANFEVNIEDDWLTVITDNSDPAVQIHIERSDSMESYLPLKSGRTHLTELIWSRKEAYPHGPTTDIGYIPSPSFRNFVGKLISYVQKTLQPLGS